MDLFDDAQRIYSPKSREYFKEVISSYANGNFRSAIVMLYSVCICDLLFKLQELKDMYNDSIAKNIIDNIEKNKAVSASKSSWEKELVDHIKSKTNLLDLEGYTNLSHLYDYRNLSAHPALNGELELISPQKEIVAAYIRTALDTILLKPAIFVKDVIGVMSNDLDEKKGYILEEVAVFEEYVKNKYLVRMPDAMYQKVFRTFWRFAFKTANEICDKNRRINVLLLELMYKLRGDLIRADISQNQDKYEVSNNPDKLPIFMFLADCPAIYPLLAAHVKQFIESIYDDTCKLLSWFMTDKQAHINRLIEDRKFIFIKNVPFINYIVNKYRDDGVIDICLTYLIKVVGDASSFLGAGTRIEYYIFPFLPLMKFQHFKLIFQTIEDCNSLKNNQYLGSKYCPRIWEYAEKTLPEDYDMSVYPHFKIPTVDE